MILRDWLFVFALMAACNLQARTVLVVESYHAEHPWDISYKKGLEQALSPAHKLVYFEMDTKRIPQANFQAKADAAWQLYQRLSPQLVVLADDNALKYLAPKFLYTDTPVVYLGINANPRVYGVVGPSNFYGVMERPLIKRAVIMLKQLIPIKRVLVMLDTSMTAETLYDNNFYGKPAHRLAGVRVDVVQFKHFSDWQNMVQQAKHLGYDALIVGLYHDLRDQAGNHVAAEQVMQWTSSHTKVPPFGLWAFSVGANKTIGGNVVFGYEEGKLAGQMAARLLNGESVLRTPQMTIHGQFMLSKSQLKKWQISAPKEVLQKAQLVD